MILGDLGELSLDRNQWAEARKWLEMEFPLAKEIVQLELIAQAQPGLASVHEAEGVVDLALQPAKETLKIYERLQTLHLKEMRKFVNELGQKMNAEESKD